MHYKANWLLIVDNLSDFAHLAFVHTKTLGGSEEYAFVTKPVAVERLARGFRVERWHMNAAAAAVPPQGHSETHRTSVDRRNIGHMEIPGIFMLESLFAPAGNGAEKGNFARRARVPQLPVHDTRDAPHHALLLELPEQLRRRPALASRSRCTRA